MPVINNTTKASPAPVVRSEGQRTDAATARTRRANFGGPRLKMSVPRQIEGFHLYWANDQDGEIEQLLYEGFEFVTPDEVALLTPDVKRDSHIVADGDLGHRVSRYVGSKADGSPLRAFLLKCPNEIWDDREQDRYDMASDRDSAVRSGQAGERDSSRYTPKGMGISVDTGFRKQY